MMKKGFHMMNVGASSFLVIFTVLALVTFAVLSVSSANADQQLSDKVLESTTAYYQAENQAEETLAQIDQALSQGAPPDDTTLPDLLPPGCIWDAGSRTIAFTKEMGDGQALAISLTLPPEGTTYQITRWQVIATNDWQPDNTLPVITLN
ncbi:hypothetical protein [Eubacterium sp.]|uniref:hypothetical protein n=1 Tax=Eubacterium sp. TaxID=142586 RepID=UPI002FC94C77